MKIGFLSLCLTLFAVLIFFSFDLWVCESACHAMYFAWCFSLLVNRMCVFSHFLCVCVCSVCIRIGYLVLSLQATKWKVQYDVIYLLDLF